MKEIDMKSQTSRRGWETWVGCATAALLLSGRLSPLASKEFTKRDWKMFESYTIAAEQ
jgi:hypothetical protein